MKDPKFISTEFIELIDKCFEIGSKTNGKEDPKKRFINIKEEYIHLLEHAVSGMKGKPDEVSGLSHWVHVACRAYLAWLADMYTYSFKLIPVEECCDCPFHQLQDFKSFICDHPLTLYFADSGIKRPHVELKGDMSVSKVHNCPKKIRWNISIQS